MRNQRPEFNDEAIYAAYYTLLKNDLQNYSKAHKIKTGVKLYSPDEVSNTTTQFPCVSFEIFGHETVESAADLCGIDYYTRFSVEVNVYTKGKNKYSNCLNLANAIIKSLQDPVYMDKEYLTKGLLVREKTRTPYLDNEICRFTIRLSGMCDNVNKIIQPR